MPTLNQSAHISTVRKTARRNRRLRSRARRVNQQIPALSPSRRPTKRRRLREQVSFDLQDCLYDCLDHGYHLDEDVRIGHGVPLNGNHFSLLDLDVTDPTSTAAPESISWGVTNSPPGCAAFLLPEQFSPDKTSQAKRRVVPIDKKPQYPETDEETPTLTSSLVRPAPTVPDATPRPRLPDPYPGPVREEYSGQYRPGYLDSIHIPSPMLYHSQSGHNVALSIEKDFPTFELAYTQPPREPDFTSYRVLEDTERLLSPRLSSHEETDFVAAALPLMGRGGRPETPHSITAPSSRPLIPNEYSWDMNGANNSYPSERSCHPNFNQLTVQHTVPSQYHASTMDHISRQSMPYPNPLVGFHQISRINDDNLVFSKAAPPALIESTVSSGRSPNNIIEPWANRAGSGDEAGSSRTVTISGMLWDDLQPANRTDRAQGPSPTVPADRHHLPTKGDGVIRSSPDSADETKLASTAVAKCTNLGAVKLHRHRFSGWPSQSCSFNEDPTVFNLSQANMELQNSRTARVSKMAEWLKDVQRAWKQSPSGQGDLDHDDVAQTMVNRLFEQAVQRCNEEAERRKPDLKPAESTNDMVGTATEINGARGHQVEDEAYYTANEDDDDVELVNEGQSDDEWADGDWDWEVESDGEEERIGLYATEWEVLKVSTQ